MKTNKLLFLILSLFVFSSKTTWANTSKNSENKEEKLLCATSSSITVTACNSYTSPSGIYNLSSSGIYLDTIPNSAGCDSVITINLTINNASTASLTLTACNSYSSPSGNQTWTSSGIYVDTLANSAGCDSIITIDLTITNSSTNSITVTSCNSYTSPSGNQTWTNSGTYSDTLSNAAGCDSILTVNLTIISSSTNSISLTACNSYTSPSGNYTWTNSGTYFDTIPNAAGCDSIISINLSINTSSTSITTVTACNTFTSPSGNNTWTNSGTYFDTIPNAVGCDSIITFNLTINNSTSSSQIITACDAYSSPSGKYNWTSSGTYFDTIPNSSGCDSVITFTLTILNSSTNSITASACHYYISPSTNFIWTSSGIYSDTLVNALGCDSVITVDLSIGDNTASISQTACDSIVVNGQKYTSSGIYTQTLTNVAGCDSTLTLNLTIGHTFDGTFTQSACDSYFWEGQIYSSSGLYQVNYITSLGCDSILHLNLTLNQSSSSSIIDTACSNYTLNGTTYTSSGTYSQIISNSAGCDSTITLQLTLKSTSNSINQTSCDSILVNGQNYTSSGVYTQTLVNAAGCDSILTLHLTVNQGTVLNSTTTACKSYFVNGTTFTSSGIYHLPFVNANGCNSVLNLNLTINQPDTTVTQNVFLLSSNANGATYQWLNCSNGNAAIPGANSKTYTPTSNGFYAVVVTQNACSDTSACYPVLTIGMDENSAASEEIRIFPNPSSSGQLTLEFSGVKAVPREVKIYSLLGAQVFAKQIIPNQTSKYSLDLSALAKGTYFACINTENESKVVRLVIE